MEINKNNTGNIFVTVIAFLACVLIAVSACLLWQKQGTEIPNWQKYTNQKYNFSLSYPKNWYAYRESDSEKYFYIEIANQKLVGQQPPSKDYKNVIVEVLRPGWRLPQNPKNNEDQYLTKDTDLTYLIRIEHGLWPDDIFATKLKETKLIGGREAIRFVSPDGQASTPWYVRVENNIYRFDGSLIFSDSRSLENQILDSFKFLKTGLTKYVSQKYKFSIEYDPALQISTMTDQTDHQSVFLFDSNIKMSQIIIDRREKKSGQTLTDWIKNNYKICVTCKIFSIQDKSVNGYSAVYVLETGGSSVFIKKDETNMIDTALSLSENLTDGEKTQMRKYFDQVVSSFRFN